ncbi:MAG: hypothetical protein WKG07_10010 [Hymenobacter sp.]
MPAGYSCTEVVSRQQRTADSLLLPLDKSQAPGRPAPPGSRG